VRKGWPDQFQSPDNFGLVPRIGEGLHVFPRLV
jgi:hypothetical protein